ncbi:MAG: Inositol 2-dehydrogenase [Firmicutes bacterium ADurb.Bin193]|nr:MAG: Inositol 2-dehydrogenase [Firmicutes bacterium ADurb.Bin193]
MKKINAGIIGVGFIGVAHIEALRRLSNVNVVAIADDESVVKAKAEQLGVDTYYSDWQQLINSKDIDCVHICTPNHLHYMMAKAALSAGKHVVCEKPLTTNKSETEELVALAEQKGLVNAVNFNVRFYPLVQQIKAAIENGDMGRIFSVHGSYLQDWLFYDTDYNWRLEPETAGESRAVADIGSHWMDLIEFITGLRATEVFADFATFHKTRKKPLKPIETYAGKLLKPEDYKEVPINTEDYATVIFRFDNGARGALTVSQVCAGRKNRITFEIAGSKKAAAWTSESPNEVWIGKRDGANELLIRDPSLVYPGSRELIDYPGGHNEGFPDTFKQNFKKIYGVISGEKTVKEYPEFSAGLRGISLCEKIVQSNKTDSWVKI